MSSKLSNEIGLVFTRCLTELSAVLRLSQFNKLSVLQSMMKVIGMCFSCDTLLSCLGHHKDESSYVAGTYVYIYIYKCVCFMFIKTSQSFLAVQVLPVTVECCFYSPYKSLSHCEMLNVIHYYIAVLLHPPPPPHTHTSLLITVFHSLRLV